MHLLQCVVCDEKFTITGDLQKHLKAENHCGIGEKSKWDQPEFFFSTYEDDAILCYLEDTAPDTDGYLSECSEAVVFSEDTTTLLNRDAEELSVENVNKLFQKI